MSGVSLYGQDTDTTRSELISIKVGDRKDGIVVQSTGNFSNPIFVILADHKSLEVSNNPHATDSVSLNQFLPDWIESIEVLKGQPSTDKYGVRGQYGAVLITLRKDILNTLPFEISRKFK